MKMSSHRALLLGAGAALFLSSASIAGGGTVVPMNLIDESGIGRSIGSVTLEDSDTGLLLKLDLSDELPVGPHGFHVHTNPDCASAEKDGKAVAGLAAGGHFDPAGKGKHLGPSGEGHLGDLPILYVNGDDNGAFKTKHVLVAPRIKIADILGRSLMIHAGGDNFRDDPKPLGGGGARIACGVIPAS